MAVTGHSTRNFVPMQNKYDRVILLVDMDCFYCQVEEKLDPNLKGKPLAVVQYNAWRGGGIIAVNYAARAKGVTRHMRGDEAKEQCPEIELVKVPNVREKADLSKYRDAGKDVANVLQRFTNLLERASVDEAYLDITASVNKRLENMNNSLFVLQPEQFINTYAVGYGHIGEYINSITSRLSKPYIDDEALNYAHNPDDVPSVRQSDIRLLIGASIASEIRAEVKSVTGYECSAGVAHNKILAKLACGINKPNKQTILPLAQIPILFETLAIGKIKGLGGKFGEELCERLKIRYLGQLLKFTESELQKKFDEKNGTWLYNICRGIDLEAVTPRFYSKSIGCCKKFPGRNNITGINTLKHWLTELATEINDRLEKDICENNRKAKQIVVSFIQEFDGVEISSSRSAPLTNYDKEILARNCLDIIKSNTKQFLRTGSGAVLNNPIKFLGISVGKFETITNAQNKLQEMFANQVAKKRKSNDEVVDKAKNSNGNSNIDLNVNASSREDVTIKSFLIKDLPLIEEGMLGTQVKKFKESNVASETSDAQNSKNIGNNKSSLLKKFLIKPTLQQIDNKIKNSTCENNSESSKGISEKPRTQNASEHNTTNNDNDQIERTEENNIYEETIVYHKDSLNDDISAVTEEDDLECLEEEIAIVEKEQYSEHFNDCLTNVSNMENSAQNKIALDDEKENKISELNYTNSYAEYAVPELILNQFPHIKCEQCGLKIPDDQLAIQTHQDHHFAQQLSYQQRNDYRAEIQAKITTANSKNVSKKAKKSTDQKVIKADITKFLKSTVESHDDTILNLSDEPTTSKQAALERESNEMVTCGECKALVKKCEMLEHKDFHLAKALQKELNRLEVRTVDIVKKPNATQSNKSLNGTIINHTTSKNSVSKPITKFFPHMNS